MPLQQQDVAALWEGVLELPQYGELTHEVTFKAPVLITGVRAATTGGGPVLLLPQAVKGYAKNLHTPTAATFALLFDAVEVPRQGASEQQVTQVFPTQHVWLRGRCQRLQVQLLGHALDAAAQQLQEAAEARLGPLPDAGGILRFPSRQQQQQQQQPGRSLTAAADAGSTPPSMQRPPGRLLPFVRIPPRFVLALTPLADYWSRRHPRTIPLRKGRKLPDPHLLQACQDMGEAVLAAHRGSPACLEALLASQDKHAGKRAVDWDSIRDSVLDMATYCCSALADGLSAPKDVSLALAGVYVAIVLAACQDGAAQFLSWPNGGVGVAGAIAVRELVSMRNAPPQWQSLSVGLLDLLLESCPVIACPAFTGTSNPAGVPEPQQEAQEGQAAASNIADASTADPSNADGSTAEKSCAGNPSGSLLDGAAAQAKQHAADGVVAASAANGLPANGRAEGLGAAKRAAAVAGEAAAGGPEQSAAKRQRVEGHLSKDAETADKEQPQPQPPQQQQGEVARRDPDNLPGADLDRADELDPEAVSSFADDEVQANGDAEGGGQLGGKQQGVQQAAAAAAGGGEAGQQDGGEEAAGAAEGDAELSEGWDPDRADADGEDQQRSDSPDPLAGLNDSDELEAVQDGNGDGGGSKQQQERVLEEGDYEEADEALIAAEAEAKTSRRRVELRPPVRQLAGGQLYSAVSQLAMTAQQVLQQDTAASCQSVLRRLRAFQCLDVLQSTIGPMLAGKADALLLATQQACAHVAQVTAAVHELTDLVLQPQPSKRAGEASGSLLQQQLSEQDPDLCVLKLLLSFRALELLAALNCLLGLHLSRLQQHQDTEQPPQQQKPSQTHQGNLQQQQQQQPKQPSKPPDQLQHAELCRQQCQLLDAIQALLAVLMASSGGWCFLTAAKDGLAALAAAVCPSQKVSLDCRAPVLNMPAHHSLQHRWGADQQAALAAASGLSRAHLHTAHAAHAPQAAPPPTAAAAAQSVSASLQHLWLLVEATSRLQGADGVLWGSSRDPAAAEALSAALKTLFMVGLGSESGRQQLVSALSRCPGAVRGLVLLLQHYGHIQALAAGEQGECLSGGQGGGSSQGHASWSQSREQHPVYGALYVPELLLALVSSSDPQALAAWLPHSDMLWRILENQRKQQEQYGPSAVKAAFRTWLPDASAPSEQPSLAAASLAGGVPAVLDGCERVLIDLQGAVLTARNLVQLWSNRAADQPLGAGSSTRMVQWLHGQLPKLDEAAKAKPAATDELGDEKAKVLPPVSAMEAVFAAADALQDPDEAAAARVVTGLGDTRDAKLASAAVEFMGGPCKSAALCALNLLNMLLNGAPRRVRSIARNACKPRASSGQQQQHVGFGRQPQSLVAQTQQLQDGFDGRAVLQELSSPGPAGRNEVTVFHVLEQALRTAAAVLAAADANITWAVQGGSPQDMLAVLRARTDAAALMHAACSATASLLVHLAGPSLPQSCCIRDERFLQALLGAHTALVACTEGLQASLPDPQLVPYVAQAAAPGLTPVQRAAAEAAVVSATMRACNKRVLLLLESRQALAVCLRCWQLQGWWPDPVGALLGVYPRGSAATEKFAKQDAAARMAGDLRAPPAPVQYQGPGQRLAALTGLADLCPEEWPPRGASQLAARQRDEADKAEAAAGVQGSAFPCPTLIGLRQKLVCSLSSHQAELCSLTSFGLDCSTRMARAALVRLLARWGGVCSTAAPLLATKVLFTLCTRLTEFQLSRKGLASRLHAIKASPESQSVKQQVDHNISTLQLQLRRAVHVAEVLLPLCQAPSFKAVLVAHKAAAVLGKGLYWLLHPETDLQAFAADEQVNHGSTNGSRGSAQHLPSAGAGLAAVEAEGQVLAGLLLQLISVLMDADISMTPWADRLTRELHNTPSIPTGSCTVAWLLCAVPYLSPSNMAAFARLLLGQGSAQAPQQQQEQQQERQQQQRRERQQERQQQQQEVAATAAGSGARRGLRECVKGRAVLLRAAQQWKLLQQWLQEAEARRSMQARMGKPPAPQQQQQQPLQDAPGHSPTRAELVQSCEWAAAALEGSQWVGGPDASHAASCAALAQAFRQLGASVSECAQAWREYEEAAAAEKGLKLESPPARFMAAAQAAAAQHSNTPASQSISAQLSSAPLLLACDAASLDFWDASAASAAHAAAHPLPATTYPHNAALPTCSASSWWPQVQLAKAPERRGLSRGLQQVQERAQDEEQQQRDRLVAGHDEGDEEEEAEGVAMPKIYAARARQTFGEGARVVSVPVDQFMKQQEEKKQKKTKTKKLQQRQQQHRMPPPPPPPPPPPRPGPGPNGPGGKQAGGAPAGWGRPSPRDGPENWPGGGMSSPAGEFGGPEFGPGGRPPPFSGAAGPAAAAAAGPVDPRLRRRQQQHGHGLGQGSPFSPTSPVSPAGQGYPADPQAAAAAGAHVGWGPGRRGATVSVSPAGAAYPPPPPRAPATHAAAAAAAAAVGGYGVGVGGVMGVDGSGSPVGDGGDDQELLAALGRSSPLYGDMEADEPAGRSSTPGDAPYNPSEAV